MPDKEEMYRVLDYLLNRSTTEELEVIEEAIKRRKEDLRRGIAGVNLRDRAHRTADVIHKMFGEQGEIRSMIRRFIREIVEQNQPDISPDDLEKILEDALPETSPEEPGGAGAGQGDMPLGTDQLPREAIESMIVQFVDFSLGRMATTDREDLPPDWSKRYWNAFSPQVRQLVSDLLNGRMTEQEFWREIKK